MSSLVLYQMWNILHVYPVTGQLPRVEYPPVVNAVILDLKYNCTREALVVMFRGNMH